MITVHDPKFKGTNIEAYLLPYPHLSSEEYQLTDDENCLKDIEKYLNSKITISVNSELSTYIRTVTNYEHETSKVVDISHIMDRIEVIEQMPKLTIVGQFKSCTYSAKLKQVDTVEDNEAEKFNTEYNDFNSWAYNNGWTFYLDLLQWRKSVQYKTTQELYKLFKTQK